MQFDQEERGFSFQKEGPLDMRMNPSDTLSAEEIVNTWPEKELERVFREYGEDRNCRKHAKIIVRERSKRPIKTTKHLADLIHKISNRFRKKIHPATQVFQALRICVNKELESVESGIKHALGRLKQKGKVGVISFHSLEDRVVKNLFKQVTQPIRDDRGKKVQEAAFALLTKKPIVPLKSEVQKNRRSRSAKFRGAQRMP